MLFAIYIVVGLLVGCVGALIGLGGGIFVIPLMTIVFGATPNQAAGTSIIVVMLNSFSGALGYLKKKMVCIDAAWKFALATIPGALLGGYVSDILSGDAMYIVFSFFFIALALYMFFKSQPSATCDGYSIPQSYNWRLGATLSTLVGFISSILGIGGGLIHVPMMTYLLRFPIKVSIATSTAILFVSAVFGALSHGFLGHVLWVPALSIGIGALFGAQIGVRLAGRIRSSLLVKFAALLLLLISAKFISGVI